jgi:hypothetical protein
MGSIIVLVFYNDSFQLYKNITYKNIANTTTFNYIT